jgi:hypothetical protein
VHHVLKDDELVQPSFFFFIRAMKKGNQFFWSLNRSVSSMGFNQKHILMLQDKFGRDGLREACKINFIRGR